MDGTSGDLGFMIIMIMMVIVDLGVSKNNGTPKSSILIVFSIINHPFWGTPNSWKHPPFFCILHDGFPFFTVTRGLFQDPSAASTVYKNIAVCS